MFHQEGRIKPSYICLFFSSSTVKHFELQSSNHEPPLNARFRTLVTVSDWFIVLFPFVVIGQMCRIVGFTKVNCKPPIVLYLFNQKHLFMVTRKINHLYRVVKAMKGQCKGTFPKKMKALLLKKEKKRIFILYENRFHR